MVAQGQDDRARFVLARVLHEHPDFVPAYCMMAELQMRSRHVDEAIDSVGRVSAGGARARCRGRSRRRKRRGGRGRRTDADQIIRGEGDGGA